jgi:hypothetical protein
MNAWDKAKGPHTEHGPIHPAAAHGKADGAALHARAGARHGKPKPPAAGHAISRRREAHPPA